MSKVCKSCGLLIENDNARFCEGCGAALDPASVVETPSTANPAEDVFLEEDDDEDIYENVAAFPQAQVTPTIIDDDDSPEDYPAADEEPVSSSDAIVVDDEDDDYEPVQAPRQSDVPNEGTKKRGLSFPVKRQVKSEVQDAPRLAGMYDGVINDPYFDDLLPAIDEELEFIPKDIIVKVVVAFLASLGVAIFFVLT